MFGLGFGEIFLIVVIGLVVVGPRNLPTLMRTAGRWVSKIKRMSTELRSQSGIDDIIRDENLEREIMELRSLSRMNIVDTLVKPALPKAAAAVAAQTISKPYVDATKSPASGPRPSVLLPGRDPVREREYPVIGCDAYGALPDDIEPYVPEKPAAKAPAPVEETKQPETADADSSKVDDSKTDKAAEEPSA